jgi:hypothetical protein
MNQPHKVQERAQRRKLGRARVLLGRKRTLALAQVAVSPYRTAPDKPYEKCSIDGSRTVEKLRWRGEAGDEEVPPAVRRALERKGIRAIQTQLIHCLSVQKALGIHLKQESHKESAVFRDRGEDQASTPRSHHSAYSGDFEDMVDDIQSAPIIVSAGEEFCQGDDNECLSAWSFAGEGSPALLKKERGPLHRG